MQMNIVPKLSRIQIKIMSVATFVLLVVAVMCLCFCRHSYPRQLVSIDSLCDSHPERAKALLKRIPAKDIEAKANRMYYDLLKIKASNNLYEPQQDSTIFRVADYFESHGDKNKRRDAYYLLGKYFVEHNDAPQALKWFQTALDQSDDDTPLAFKSKVYSQSGGLFLDQNLYRKALAMYRESYICDSILKDTVNVIHNLRDMAQVYRHLEKTDSCIVLLDKAFSLSDRIDNAFVKKTIALALVGLYLSDEKPQAAHHVFSEYLTDVEDNIKSPTYAAAVSIYNGIGKEDSAYIYSIRLLSIGTLSAKETALKYLMDYYSVHRNFDKMSECMEKYKSVSDSAKMKNASEAVLKINSLYDYGLREKENDMLRNNERIRNFVFVSVVLFLVMVICFILYKREQSMKRLEKIMYINEHLEQLYKTSCVQHDISIKQKETEITSLREKLKKNGYDSIEEKKKMRIYEILRGNIKNNKKVSEKSWGEIFMLVDSVYPTFRQKLIGSYGLDNEENKICILVKLGLLNIEIATIMCKSPGAITQKRALMYKKIFNEDGSSKRFNIFIKSLE